MVCLLREEQHFQQLLWSVNSNDFNLYVIGRQARWLIRKFVCTSQPHSCGTIQQSKNPPCTIMHKRDTPWMFTYRWISWYKHNLPINITYIHPLAQQSNSNCAESTSHTYITNISYNLIIDYSTGKDSMDQLLQKKLLLPPLNFIYAPKFYLFYFLKNNPALLLIKA
jgi:hypothetical protein